MNLDLNNRTALVCGASQGLGAAVAKELALLGANIILLARTEINLQNVQSKLDVSKGQKHQYIIADTSKPLELFEKVKTFLEEGNLVDIIINNSGGPAAGSLLNTSVQEMETAFDSHLIVAHLLAQLLVPGMKDRGFGRIINILSTSIKQPINGLGISNSIRAAVANWAKTLANEIGGYGITVNNVLPGYTNTDRLDYLFSKQADAAQVTKDDILKRTLDLIPAGRLGEPHEFGAAVAFLCSPAAAYINGINLPVDGGRLGTL
jgi:3-oxoacyl-[acyl-carrier protein] reductase